jgi:hypothetical protein
MQGHITTIPPSNTFVPKYIIPANTNPKSAFVQEIPSRREGISGAKVTGPRSKVTASKMPPRDTPLSPNTSTL